MCSTPRVKIKKRLTVKAHLIVRLRGQKMPFNLFHKKKQPEQQTLIKQPEQPPQTTVPEETPVEEPQPAQDAAPEPAAPAPELANEATKEEQPPTESEQTASMQEQPQEAPSPIPQEQTEPEPTTETPAPAPQEETKPAEQAPPQEEQSLLAKEEPASKMYLKAMPLKDLADVETVKNEVLNGNIIILRITPLAGKSIEDVKTAVNELFTFAESIQGDIARLGEERVVICPKPVRIWREKTPAPVANKGPLPTAA